MSTIIDKRAVHPIEGAQVIASTVLARRLNLAVSVAELARASGIPARRIAAIECGGPLNRSERYDMAMAFGWLSNNRIARGRAART